MRGENVGVRVCRMEREHIFGVACLERENFSQPWSEKSLELLLGESGAAFVALGEDGEVLAYGGMMTVLDEAQVTNVATKEECRGRGIASLVLLAMLDYAKARGALSVSLEVRESNLAAIALYRKFGFETVGTRKNFYSSPRENALVMTTKLPE